jgi:hypothetical protein
MTIAPILVIIGIFTHLNLGGNQGEYQDNFIYLYLVIIILTLNTVNIIILYLNNIDNFRKTKILNTFSILFGTPVIILLWLGYHNTLRMNLVIKKPEYLKDECFMKIKNIYLSENRYNYAKDNCDIIQPIEDSIIITEVYRWGSIKSCEIIIKGKHFEIDTSKINFLARKEKSEILSY